MTTYYRKRRRTADTLTGGTKDYNPQLVSGIAEQSGADTTTTATITLPTSTYMQVGSRSTVFEVLKVHIVWENMTNVIVANGTINARCGIAIGTRNHGTTNATYQNPDVFLYHEWVQRAFENDAASVSHYAIDGSVSRQFDLTDGMGHGLLIGSNQLFFQVHSANTSVGCDIQYSIMYRYKAVDLSEYIGIVQSQV